MASYTKELQQLYVAYYNRPADPTGLAYWQGAVAKAVAGGTSVAQAVASVSAFFAASPEYTTAFAGKSNLQIVDQIYQNLLGRSPDVGGLIYWTGRLDSGTLTLADIVTVVSSTAQGQAADSIDKIAFEAKVTVATAFTEALNTVDELLGYSGTTALALAKAFITTVKDAATLAAAIAPAALAATVANVVASGGVAGQTFTLTTGVDTFTGGTGNDTFNASGTTLTGLDTIDGGGGTDTLNIPDATGGLIDVSLPTSVKNIETANLTTVGSLAGNAANVSGWTGLTALNVVTKATAANQTLTAATTTTVTATNSTAWGFDVIGGGGVLTVTAGAGTITATNAAANAFTKAVFSGGTTVGIKDNSGASAAIGTLLTSVSLSGNTGAATLEGKGLINVTIEDGVAASDVTITNATAAHTQNLTVNGNATGVVITDATATTVNVATVTKASAVALAVKAATTLNTSGAVALTLDATGADYTALTTVNIANTGAFTADLSKATTASAAAITKIDASTSTGANTVTITADQETYTGGSGVDKVTIGEVATKVIDGGAGTADEIIVNTATFAANATKLLNFETLAMGALATGGAFDATGFKNLAVHGTITGNSSFSNVAPAAELTIDGLLNLAVTYTLKDASLTTDAATIHVGNATTAGLDITASNGSVVTTGVELITIDSLGTGTGTNTLAVTNAGATTLNVTGGQAITLTGFAGSTLTTINTSAATKLVDVSALTVAAAGTTVTGGAGGLKFIGGAGVDTVTGGAGADTIATAGGKDVIVGGGGADLITAGAAADKITVSGTTGKIIQAAGDSGSNTSTTIQTAELTSTFDVVYGASAGFKIDLGNTDLSTAALTTAGTNLAAVGGNVTPTNSAAIFARGTYDSAAGTFTYAANGADSVLTYDSTVGATVTPEAIILVGFVSGASTFGAADGILTLV